MAREVNPTMAFMGVRMSWDILDKKMLFVSEYVYEEDRALLSQKLSAENLKKELNTEGVNQLRLPFFIFLFLKFLGRTVQQKTLVETFKRKFIL